MTNPYTGPTPQERELARADFLLARPGEPTGDNWALGFEWGWAIGCRRAKAEASQSAESLRLAEARRDAPLLAEAKLLADDLPTYTSYDPNRRATLSLTDERVAHLRAAIATATRKE